MMNTRFRNIVLTMVCLSLVAVLVLANPLQDSTEPSQTEGENQETAAAVMLDAGNDASNAAVVAYTVTLDVNPSIELAVADGLVTSVQAYNDDGIVITLTADVVGKPVEEAVRMLVTAMAEEEYLMPAEDEPYLIVTVSNGDQLVVEDAAELLGKAAEDVLEQLEIDCDVRSAYIPYAVAAAAAALEISAGRYIVLQAAADAEGISIQDAIELYGSMKINALVKQFPDAKDSFKDYNKSMEMDDDETEEENEGMTAEQAALFQEALELYHQEMEAAREEFHMAMESLKADIRNQLDSLEKPAGKDGRDQYKDTVKEIRDTAKANRQLVIETMKEKVKEAQQTFMDAKISLGLTGDGIDEMPEEEFELDEADFDVGDFIDSRLDEEDDEDVDEDADEEAQEIAEDSEEDDSDEDENNDSEEDEEEDEN